MSLVHRAACGLGWLALLCCSELAFAGEPPGDDAGEPCPSGGACAEAGAPSSCPPGAVCGEPSQPGDCPPGAACDAAAAPPPCPPGAVCELVEVEPPARATEVPEGIVVPAATRPAAPPGYEGVAVDDLYPNGPASMPYDPDEPIPAGYHRHSGPNEDLMVAAAVVLGVSYGPLRFIAAAAADSDNPDAAPYAVYAVPVAGPLLFNAIVEPNPIIRDLDIALATAQAGGVILLGLGLSLYDDELVRDDLGLDAHAPAPRVALTPLASSTLAGLGVSGTF